MLVIISALFLISGLAAGMNMKPLHEQEPHSHLATLAVQAPPTCNLNSCSSLSNTINCVMSAIRSGDPAALQRCLSTGSEDQICSCVACIPPLLSIFESLGVCVTSPSPNPSPGESSSELVTHYPKTEEPTPSSRASPTSIRVSVTSPMPSPAPTSSLTSAPMYVTTSLSVVVSSTLIGDSSRAVSTFSKMSRRSE